MRLLKKDRREIPEVRDIRDEDDQAFLEKSKEHLEALEVIRQEKLSSFKLRKRIAIPVATVLAPITAYIDYWLMFLQRASNDDSGAGITILLAGGLYWWVTQPRRQYAQAYKEKILPELATLFGNFVYWIDGEIPAHKLQPSKILPRYDRYETEDYFSGQYKGVNVEFSEVKFKQKRRSKNRTYYVTVFQGLAVFLEMKAKRFYGHTILDRDRGKVSEWFQEKSSKLRRANLVDPEFEKIFDVYTDDQVEARYLIDPIMIEKLKALQDQYDGENVRGAFYDERVLLLIESKHNYFEPAELEIPASDPRSILNMKKEIGEILSLIDHLALFDPREVHEKAV